MKMLHGVASDIPDNANALEILLGRRLSSEDSLDVFRHIETGFQLSDVVQALLSLDVLKDKHVMTQIIGMPASALHRRSRGPDRALDSIHSERLFRFAVVSTRAANVFGDKQLAIEWMVKPALGLEGYSPIALLANNAGYDIVLSLLGRIEYGVYH